MTKQNFDALNELEQLSVVLAEGILLSQHKSESEKIFLYQLDEFYTLVTFDLQSDLMRSILTMEDCAGFLGQMDQNEGIGDPASRPYQP